MLKLFTYRLDSQIGFKWLSWDYIYITTYGDLFFTDFSCATFMHENEKIDLDLHYSNSISPELLMGSSLSPPSNVFLGGCFFYHVFTGRFYVKKNEEVKEQMRGVFKVLGTPSTNRYLSAYLTLPKAPDIGSKVPDQRTGELQECRARITKNFLGHIPGEWKEGNFRENEVKEVFQACMHLDPAQRLSCHEILQLSFFKDLVEDEGKLQLSREDRRRVVMNMKECFLSRKRKRSSEVSSHENEHEEAERLEE